MNIQSSNTMMNQIVINEHEGALRVTSRQVAESFGKRHSNVVRAIRNLKCSEEFFCTNFYQSTYDNDQNGMTYFMYEMNYDGFTFLTLGFTGKRSALCKEMILTDIQSK